ncbi:uncharacterized protein LOC110706678 [Chenopodium quinoa]|uniref:J domain-containing protein n=1 Tax=Chenopodium quinoa TaxID=63459 RepID=A0A803MEG6_CHEQI|nr:uncharacterized protein LOC110706678 [Chenopodium quinoa]
MMWEENRFDEHYNNDEQQQESPFNFDFLSLLSKPKDYYRILEVDYDATEEAIRSNYIRLALKWHPDKQKGQDGSTSKFQEINEAYQVLSDPMKRQEYDMKGMMTYDYNVMDYLNRYKGLILTCNGLGMKHSIW